MAVFFRENRLNLLYTYAFRKCEQLINEIHAKTIKKKENRMKILHIYDNFLFEASKIVKK